MTFKWINIAYFAIWYFNLLTFYAAKRLDDYVISQRTRSILKYHPFVLILLSIVIMIITCFLSTDVTRTIMGVYFLLSFIDLLITGLIVSLIERSEK